MKIITEKLDIQSIALTPFYGRPSSMIELRAAIADGAHVMLGVEAASALGETLGVPINPSPDVAYTYPGDEIYVVQRESDSWKVTRVVRAPIR